MKPNVSVIVPTYNRIAMLDEALSSVVNQDFDGVVEIIVVDDNSRDGTVEMVRAKYPDVHLISLMHNVGAPAARNQALLKAQGQYIAFLDSDDLWKENYLKTQITTLTHKKSHFCVSPIVIWNTVTNKQKIDLQIPDFERFSSPLHHLLVNSSFIRTPSSVVFPRQVFEEVGLFDETYRVSEDSDLYIRCLIAGYQIIYSEEPSAIWRKHSSGQLTNVKDYEIRKQSRLDRINRLYPLLKQQAELGSISQIRAEIYANFTRSYLRDKRLLSWLLSYKNVASNTSALCALKVIFSDFKKIIKSSISKLSQYTTLPMRSL